MNKIWLGIGALVLGLAFVGEASAAPRTVVGGGRGGYSRTYFGATPYHLRHGVRFGGGYYFAGRRHAHWSHRTWSPVMRRYHYFDPYLRVYYFYDPISLRWMPVRTVGFGGIGPVGPVGLGGFIR